ncbi:MAG: CYTH domain-containing protein [Bacteroidales bacterium]|nr:CYTH domain-containing protein [Bacteroidales bacterium]
MHIETERKFLVKDLTFKDSAVSSSRIAQGYVAHDGGNTVRVRIRDSRGILTIKGPSTNGMSRLEWEKDIPLQDAEDLLPLCHGGIIDKTRYIVPCGKRFFEVDVFHGDNEGLVMAEIELGSEDEAFEKPAWLGEEVTGDKRYYNSYLTLRPYKTWQEAIS